MEMGRVFHRSLLAYRSNLKFVLPRLFEYILDLAAIFAFLLAAAAAILISMPEIEKNFWLLFYSRGALPSVPFSLTAFLIFGLLLLFLLVLIFNACARAAIIGMAKESFAQEKTSLGTGMRSVRNHGLSVLSFTLLLSFVFAALFVVSFIPLALARALETAASTLFLLVLFAAFLAWIVIYASLFLAPQHIVVNGLGVLAAMKASYGFVRKNIGAVLIYAAVVTAVILIALLLSLLLSLPLFFVQSEFARIALQVFNDLFSMILGLIIVPYFEIVKTFMVMEDVSPAPETTEQISGTSMPQ